MILPLVGFLAAALLQQPPAVPQPSPADTPRAASTYVPERVYDTRALRFSDFEEMLAGLGEADVVLVGEQHDDPNTHSLEAAILQGLLRRTVRVAVSLEMFERDAQSALDDYLAGRLDEQGFLARSRPWPRYATDYRPLVELARAHGWPVIASNVPRAVAALVAKSGLAALDELPPDERQLAAQELECPFDEYFDRFSESMNSHPMPGSENLTAAERRAITERYYFAQCAKDETMAESIAQAAAGRVPTDGPVVHFNGAFHTDFRAGVAARVRRRLPSRRVALVTILPVRDLDAIAPAGRELERADYLVYTVRRAAHGADGKQP